MKRYIASILAISALITVLSGYKGMNNSKKKVTIRPTTSQSDAYDDDLSSSSMDNEFVIDDEEEYYASLYYGTENESADLDEEIEEENGSYSDIYEYEEPIDYSISDEFDVEDDTIQSSRNDDVYQNLVEAKNAYDAFLTNGSPSSQMRNQGTILSDQDATYIDDTFMNIYNHISNYITACESGDYSASTEEANALQSNILNGMNGIYLYRILIQPYLPVEYQSNISSDGFENNSYSNRDIILEDGKIIHIIGNDSLLSVNSSDTDFSTISKWYQMLPEILLSKYSVLNNQAESDTCNVWDESYAKRLCEEERKKIVEDGKEIYDYEPTHTEIIYDKENENFVYENYDGTAYGVLDSESDSTMRSILYIEEAIENHSADASLLENSIDELNKKQENYQYTK